ncbi:UNVERIFIED_ORG: LacI family transcriptional regulator [Martelella mediterranea]
MKEKSVTSLDVAKLAGVSRPTVSLVLNNSKAVSLSEETKQKVRNAARVLGYKPNSAALMLRRGATNTVGLVITEGRSLQVDAFIPLLHYAIAGVMREAGYSLLLETFERKENQNPYADLVVSHRIDGLLVLSPSTDDEDLKALIEQDYPVVLIGSTGHPREHCVFTSTREGTAAAASHIMDLGHRNIGCIPFSPPGFAATDSRLRELREALSAAGIALQDDAVFHGDFSAESGHAATLVLMKAKPDTTAIFAGNDTIALGVIGALTSLGLSVPGDVSVVGYDDLPFSGYIAPPLTTVGIDADKQGRMAAEMMVRRLRGEAIGETRLAMPSSFIARGSTGPVRR